MKVVINGEERLLAAHFLSNAVYDAYRNGRSWNPQQFCKVELGGVLPAWITSSEKKELAQLKTFEDVEVFAEQLDLKVLESEELKVWKSNINQFGKRNE